MNKKDTRKSRISAKEVCEMFRNAKAPDRTNLEKEAKEFYENLLSEKRLSTQMVK